LFFVWTALLQAPLSEEFVFRACMITLLTPSFGATKAGIIAPLFFGIGALGMCTCGVCCAHSGEDSIVERDWVYLVVLACF